MNTALTILIAFGPLLLGASLVHFAMKFYSKESGAAIDAKIKIIRETFDPVVVDKAEAAEAATSDQLELSVGEQDPNAAGEKTFRWPQPETISYGDLIRPSLGKSTKSVKFLSPKSSSLKAIRSRILRIKEDYEWGPGQQSTLDHIISQINKLLGNDDQGLGGLGDPNKTGQSSHNKPSA